MTGNRQGLCNWPTRLARAWFAAVLVAASCLAAPAAGILCGQEPAWKTGPSLRKQLDTPVSITWGEREARDALASLSKNTSAAVFLDRRLDPGRKLDLTVKDEPLQTVLARVAERLEGGVAVVGPVVYLGPQPTAGQLATLAAIKRQQAQQLSGEWKAKLLKSESWRWETLAEPRQLLAKLAERGGVTVANPEQIPHDLWPAVNLPAMPWTDRMTLLLAGFGLTFELNETQAAIRLVPIPERLTIEKTFTPRGDAAVAAASLRRIVPDAEIAIEGQRLRIVASAEDHDKIERLLQGETVRTTQVTPGQKRYTLTVENQPAAAVISSIAKQLGKELKYDPALLEKLKSPVTFKVKEVPLEELLDRALKPLGLSYNLTDEALEIVTRDR